MAHLIVDIETTGLLRGGNRIHCIVTKDVETGHVQVYDDRPERCFDFAKRDLEDAHSLIGHNLLSFDLPFLEEIWPDFKRPPLIWDTLICSRFFYDTNVLMEQDMRRRPEGMPPKLYGRSGLEAWGYRLGQRKGEYGKQEQAWDTYTPEMLAYCQQDVELTAALWELFERKIDQLKSPEPLRMEHDLQVIMSLQEKEGFRFDLGAADGVRQELQQRFDDLQEGLTRQFIYVPDQIFVPKRDFTYKKAGKDHDPQRGGGSHYSIKCGAEIQRLKPFNPTSRQQLAWVLINKLEMVLDKKTETGRDKVDEAILEELQLTCKEEHKPVIACFAEMLKLQKWLGQLAYGENSWLKTVAADNCIHHQCFLGTATFRQAHSHPNLGQVVSAPWARKLFLPHPGQVLVGADLQGLELRVLGHYLAKHDGGSFANTVVNGDIHQQNADRVGCSRREVKTLTYAFLYGAGDLKLGHTFAPELSDAKKRELGKELRVKFLKAIPGLDPLITKVKNHVRGHGLLPAIDGRYVHCSAEHAALNFICQSAGAILSKRWVLLIKQMLSDEGLTHGRDYSFCAYVHDEVQISSHADHVELIKDVTEAAALKAGEYYNFRVPITAEATFGKTWAETH